jgi:molecular chaperone GrpE
VAEEKDKDPKDKGFVVRDRRFWLQEDDAEVVSEPARNLPTYVEQLEERLREKEKQLAEYISAHKSSVSDMGEVRARLERDLERQTRLEVVRIVEPLLDTVENLARLLDACSQEAGIEVIAEGIAAVLNQLLLNLQKIGIKPVPTEGQRFDPKTMEALVTSEVPPGQEDLVIEELRPGFMFKDTLIRPAGVRVGVAPRG